MPGYRTCRGDVVSPASEGRWAPAHTHHSAARRLTKLHGGALRGPLFAQHYEDGLPCAHVYKLPRRDGSHDNLGVEHGC